MNQKKGRLGIKDLFVFNIALGKCSLRFVLEMETLWEREIIGCSHEMSDGFDVALWKTLWK